MDAEYMPSLWGVRLRGDELILDYCQKAMDNSAITRQDLPCELGLRYGPHPRETMDVYGYGRVSEDAPILVFFHGGYWVEGDKDMHAFVAKPFVESGLAVVVAGYPLAPESTLDQIVESARLCMTCVIKMSKQKNSAGIIISGHSAGAHLAAMVLCSQSWTSRSESLACIKGAVLFSSVLDVKPLLSTSVAKDAAITVNQAEINSPLEVVNLFPQDVFVQLVLAEHDPPPFHRQTKRYMKALLDCGIRCELVVYSDEDHFSFFQRLMDKEDEVTSQIIKNVLRETGTA
uniref:Kynurenine formamidase n=1 Tax=Ixodes ricinus TaxID=34613 RepID=A0A131XYM8_IXORI